MANKNSLGFWALICGALSLILVLMPLAIPSLYTLILASRVVAVPAIVLGIIAIVKKQDINIAIIGLVCAIATYLMPELLSTMYLEAGAEYISGSLGSFMGD